MSNMKCPFCQQELKPQTMDGVWLECWNCSYHEPSHHPFPQRILCGTKELWQELIRTRKALDVARSGLIDIFGYEGVPKYVAKHVRQVLDQSKIETALEQKE